MGGEWYYRGKALCVVSVCISVFVYSHISVFVCLRAKCSNIQYMTGCILLFYSIYVFVSLYAGVHEYFCQHMLFFQFPPSAEM